LKGLGGACWPRGRASHGRNRGVLGEVGGLDRDRIDSSGSRARRTRKTRSGIIGSRGRIVTSGRTRRIRRIRRHRTFLNEGVQPAPPWETCERL
jgi:hypothetical protein